ncbi:hypothetical protein GJ699_13645 [Duganella sp. FT80W]|uniref:Type II/III secretion system secretin-like domain-containing protein n=1 Tax=Duganella guangzhouensis TaxID=2666084 RepID=A0A6I2L2I3_9BURK|nr:hypothetical protein [Duganella guangzhouensis]MRW91034.1 hypothetical protein [Duganella guangzhouensis]
MMRWVLAALFTLHGVCYATDKGKDNLSFDLSGIEVGQVVSVIYKDALTNAYVLAPELVADKRVIAFRFSGSVAGVRADLSRLLDSLGYTISTRTGVDYIGLKKEPEQEQEVFVYKPRFRDAGYLADLLRPLFRGQFTMNHTISAPVGSKADDSAPAGSAAAMVDRNADVLVFSGVPSEVRKLEKLLIQVDYALGEIMVRGVVYEVQTGNQQGSAFSLAASLLSSKLSLNLATTTLDNSLKLSVGNADAVFSALSSDSRFKVVTQPSLRVRSGQQAHFSVGQDVPVLGAVTYQQNGVPVQSVEYRSSGVIFNLQPQIREGAVDLTVEQQLSNFVQTTTGVNTSPTLIKRELRTGVQLREGELIMLGGLTEDKETVGHSGFSFLPSFLHSKSGAHDRTELLLVLQVTKL